jgi:hypothetical protein
MLNNLRVHVADCYRRAVECRKLAALTDNPGSKTLYAARELGWVLLARSYELCDRSGLVVDELSKGGRSPRTFTCAACAARTLVCSTIFVCTNCRRVIEDR